MVLNGLWGCEGCPRPAVWVCRRFASRPAVSLEHLLDGNAAQFEQASDRVFDQIIWAGGTGRDSDRDFAARQPVAGFDLAMPMLVIVMNDTVGFDFGGIFDEI